MEKYYTFLDKCLRSSGPHAEHGPGTSGDTVLKDVVVKIGRGSLERELSAMMALGPSVTPRVLAVANSQAYVMEKLVTVPVTPDLPVWIETRLARLVWSRPPMPVQADYSVLPKAVGPIPDWALDAPACLTHGDPTFANTLFNPDDNNLRFCDPVYPRRVPQIAAIDHGKILQSMLGWERVLCGWKYPSSGWLPVHFLQDPMTARRALYWCRVALLRACDHALPPRVEHWAQYVAGSIESFLIEDFVNGPQSV